MLKDVCKPCVFGDNEFVGLRFDEGRPYVYFPRGYRLDFLDEETLRKDIIGLLAVLYRFGKPQDGYKNNLSGDDITTFPLLSYQYIIRDYIAHGYYMEKETEYKQQRRGKINWKRTIQQVKPHANDANIVYLDFVVKTDKNNENNLITKIHEYCVYESFVKLGWLYLNGDVLPPKPSIKLNKKMFIATINDALSDTFNDNKRMLFKSMINIIQQADETLSEKVDIAFGVNRFEYVWENLVDYIFGEDDKSIYFPHATWHIISGSKKESSALEPDTIMLLDNKIYILDAKYYKYGITHIPQHLPATSSIQKQITYGKFIDQSSSFSFDINNIYNAFIMPYDKTTDNEGENYKLVSIGTADWEKYSPSTPNYYYVLGVLLDTRFVIENYAKHNLLEIVELSKLIVEGLDNNKAAIIKRVNGNESL